MKIAIIDIGSNSVRLALVSNGVFSDKTVITTRLAEGMGEDKILRREAMQRTANAISFLCEKAKGADGVFAFATAAVRNAKNSQEFIDEIYHSCGIEIDVVSGEEECRIGYVGALDGKDGGVIDIGGASSEIIVVERGDCVYAKSLNVGAVTLTDRCGQVHENAENFLKETVAEYGRVPKSSFVAIGGTATSVSAILQELEPYDAKKVDGYKINKSQLLSLKNRLFSMTVEDRERLKGLAKSRAKVIACGVAILCEIMEWLKIDSLTVSEKDNLEGYYKVKLANGEKK